MEEKTEVNENFIKILNKEKVLEFKVNQKSGFEESEIIIKNSSKENIISKVYINNYKQFKCCPSILTLQKNATCKIKVIMDNKDYTISNSDVFLIISHPFENSEEISDEKKLNEIFKNNNLKEKGQKEFLVGYKKKEKHEEKKEDELVKKIKELEKEVLEDVTKEEKEKFKELGKEILEDVTEEEKEKFKELVNKALEDVKKEEMERGKDNNNNKTNKSSYVNYLIIFGLLFFIINFFLLKYFKK